MLQSIGIQLISLTGYVSGTRYVSGLLPTGYEVTIWDSAYSDKTKYSIRFGLPSSGRPYFGSNDTYFTVPD